MDEQDPLTYLEGMKILYTAAFAALCLSLGAQGLPKMDVQTLEGAKVPISSLRQEGKPTIVSFQSLKVVL